MDTVGIKKIFERDEEHRYINLVIPSMWEGIPAMDLRGKRPEELTSAERFAREMYRIKLKEIMNRDTEVLAYGNC